MESSSKKFKIEKEEVNRKIFKLPFRSNLTQSRNNYMRNMYRQILMANSMIDKEEGFENFDIQTMFVEVRYLKAPIDLMAPVSSVTGSYLKKYVPNGKMYRTKKIIQIANGTQIKYSKALI